MSKTDITDADLRAHILEAKAILPSFGERMVIGYLNSVDVRVSRQRIRECIRIIDPHGVTERRDLTRKRIKRRVYSVPYPLHTWHLDGNHKLRRWKLVIHVGMDGFTRLCVYMRCSDNNRASTVAEYFTEAIEVMQVAPTRVRTDHGLENSLVWSVMQNHKDGETDPVVVGSSVHNQRVERFNRDLNRSIRTKYGDIFYDLENDRLLNIDSAEDMFALHYVYIPRINADLALLQKSHNHHPIQTERNRTPHQLLAENWHLRNDQTITPSPLPHFPSSTGPGISPENVVITGGMFAELKEQINPLHDDGNHGRALYLTVRSFVHACNGTM